MRSEQSVANWVTVRIKFSYVTTLIDGGGRHADMLYCTISLQNYSLLRYFFPVYPILLPRVMNVKKNNIQHVFLKFLLSCLFGRDVGMGKWCSSYLFHLWKIALKLLMLNFDIGESHWYCRCKLRSCYLSQLCSWPPNINILLRNTCFVHNKK